LGIYTTQAWQLQSAFYTFYMTTKRAALHQKIRGTTRSYIENDAPPQ
jgi:hypothetical protein